MEEVMDGEADNLRIASPVVDSVEGAYEGRRRGGHSGMDADVVGGGGRGSVGAPYAELRLLCPSELGRVSTLSLEGSLPTEGYRRGSGEKSAVGSCCTGEADRSNWSDMAEATEGRVFMPMLRLASARSSCNDSSDDLRLSSGTVAEDDPSGMGFSENLTLEDRRRIWYRDAELGLKSV